MRTTSLRLPALVLACVLPACASDPDTTTSSDTSGTATTSPATATTGENTDPTTGATSTGTDTGEPGTSTGDTSTGEPGTTGTTGSTGEPGSTGALTTTDTSTGEPDTGDTGDTSTGGSDGLGQLAEDIAMSLALAVDGVYYTSESDYLWTVFAIADTTGVTDLNVKAVIAGVYVPHADPPLADRAVEVRTLAQLMDPLTTMQDWWTDYEIMQAEKYQAIRDILEGQLVNVQVFRLGEQFGNDLMGAIDVFVIGETADGDLVGMFTISVET